MYSRYSEQGQLICFIINFIGATGAEFLLGARAVPPGILGTAPCRFLQDICVFHEGVFHEYSMNIDYVKCPCSVLA